MDQMGSSRGLKSRKYGVLSFVEQQEGANVLRKTPAKERPTPSKAAPQDGIEEQVEKERAQVERDLATSKLEHQELLKRFAEIQSIAQGYDVSFGSPEIVAIGGQSDGKSSFVEALCGFQFNCVDANIGTRRPLILQLFNDPTVHTPQCRFYKDDMKGLEQDDTPVPLIEKEIRKRTNDLCGPHDISSRPIMIRVTYKLAANLTIYDLPGFRKAKEDPHGEKILKVVKSICKKPSRIICCLEQSTVEWVNTQVRPIVKELDPDFKRTIFVATKFNNRNNQFRSHEDLNKYLQSQEKTSEETFYISLPSGPHMQHLSPDQFQSALKDIYLKDFKLCLQLGIQKDQLPFLGFFNLKKHLENLLHQKQKESIQPVLNMLQTMHDQLEEQLKPKLTLYQRCQEQNVEEVVQRSIQKYCQQFFLGLQGTSQFYKVHQGFTLEEEREQSECGEWPNQGSVQEEVDIRNANYRLYGGAQLKRLMYEFCTLALSVEFPPTTDDEILVTLGMNPGHTQTWDWDWGSSELTRRKLNTIFPDLVDHLVKRCLFCFDMLSQIVTHSLKVDNSDHIFGLVLEMVQNYAIQYFEQIGKEWKDRLLKELQEMTSVVDFSFVQSGEPEYDLLNPNPQQTKERVQRQMQQTQILPKNMQDDPCISLKNRAARLFSTQRDIFVGFVRSKFHAVFLKSVFSSLPQQLRDYFQDQDPKQLRSSLFEGIGSIEEEIALCREKLQRLGREIGEFESLLKQN